MSTMDDIRRAQCETFEGVEVGPPIWVEDLFDEAIAEAAERETRRWERHRSLFGHPLARVFIVGDRLLVVRPRGGAA